MTSLTLVAEIFPVIISILGIIYGAWAASWVLKQDAGTDKMKEISNLIAEGAKTFLLREYKTILPIGVVLAVLILLAYYLGFRGDILVAALAMASFALGALGSGMAGYIGMYVTTRSASRTAQAASKAGLGGALMVSYRAGSVMGTMLASTALLVVSVLFAVYRAVTGLWGEALIATAFGASLMSLFIRVAGGIYTKAADWGADIVGKVEAGIPEDDPRNPATIADNVGDNVGDVAGMASDVYESLVVVLTGTLLLTAVFHMPLRFTVFPLLVTAAALISTLIGMQVVRGRIEGGAAGAMRRLNSSLYTTVTVTAVLVIIGAAAIFHSASVMAAVMISDILGMLTAIAVLHITENYTHYTHEPVKNIAKQATISASNVVVTGYSYGLMSAVPVLLVVALVLGASFALGYYLIGTPNPFMAGIYGTAMASTGLLSIAGIVITIDSFGPVSDNASGLAEMSGLPEQVREATDALDAIGNTTKATTKGYAIASAGLAALVLFIGFVYEIIERIMPGYSVASSEVLRTILLNTSVLRPDLLVGAFIGAALVYTFSSRTLMSVSRTAMELVEEIRRQFKEIPGILEGKNKPDYARAVDIVTGHALREFMVPGLMAVIVPVLVGLILGWVALVGLILGTILLGFPRALLMANAGGAWDNAKKYIEAKMDPSLGGKGGPAHKNAVIGDVVGDPFKDTTGPSLNPLIKVVNTVSVVFAAAVVSTNAALGIKMGLFGYALLVAIAKPLIALLLLL